MRPPAFECRVSHVAQQRGDVAEIEGDVLLDDVEHVGPRPPGCCIESERKARQQFVKSTGRVLVVRHAGDERTLRLAPAQGYAVVLVAAGEALGAASGASSARASGSRGLICR